MLDRHPIGPVGGSLDRGAHRQTDFDLIAILPFAVYRDIGGRSRLDGNGPPVDLNRKTALADPGGVADIQCEGYRFLELKMKLRMRLIGKRRLLPQNYSVIRHREF